MKATPISAASVFLDDASAVDEAIRESLIASERHHQQAFELHRDLGLDNLGEFDNPTVWRKMCEEPWAAFEYHFLAADAALDRACAIGRAYIARGVYSRRGDFKPKHKRFQCDAVKLCDMVAGLSADIGELCDGTTYLDAFLVQRDGIQVPLMSRDIHIAKLETIIDGPLISELSSILDIADIECAAREVARAEAAVAASFITASSAAEGASSAADALARMRRDRWGAHSISSALSVLAKARSNIVYV